jgi:hypothetical protein
MTELPCWFCQVCKTMLLQAEAECGHCCINPRHTHCPLPQPDAPARQSDATD